MTAGPGRSFRDVAITARVAVTCLGRGEAAHVAALRDGLSGLAPCDFPNVGIPCHIGRVAGIETDDFPDDLAAYDNRATRLAVAALGSDGFHDRLRAAIERWGAPRVGVVLGTSTSGVERLEQVYRARAPGEPLAAEYSLRHHNDHHAVTSFLIELLGAEGPAYTISTACSSSAKALIDGAQLIELGLCDAVLTGGVDSLCMTSLYGFDALELISPDPCRPFDAARRGLSIGEGAGFMLVERDGPGERLLGYGETSDALNMSTPPADGEGAARAMREALERAGLGPGEIDFVKLHGTATPSNDSAEGAAVASVFADTVPAASLKGMIGHTLGAAGGVETVMSLYAMAAGILPGTVGLETPDPAIPIAAQARSVARRLDHVVCNAFGFGGSNCALVLGRA